MITSCTADMLHQSFTAKIYYSKLKWNNKTNTTNENKPYEMK